MGGPDHWHEHVFQRARAGPDLSERIQIIALDPSLGPLGLDLKLRNGIENQGHLLWSTGTGKSIRHPLQVSFDLV